MVRQIPRDYFLEIKRHTNCSIQTQYFPQIASGWFLTGSNLSNFPFQSLDKNSMQNNNSLYSPLNNTNSMLSLKYLITHRGKFYNSNVEYGTVAIENFAQFLSCSFSRVKWSHGSPLLKICIVLNSRDFVHVSSQLIFYF